MKYIEKYLALDIPLRNWELHKYPLLQQIRQHTWTVKIATQLEKPRCVLFAMQTNRKNSYKMHMSLFSHCKLTIFKLYLNSKRYP